MGLAALPRVGIACININATALPILTSTRPHHDDDNNDNNDTTDHYDDTTICTVMTSIVARTWHTRRSIGRSRSADESAHAAANASSTKLIARAPDRCPACQPHASLRHQEALLPILGSWPTFNLAYAR